MSYEMVNVGDVTVTKHVGPAFEGRDRRRYQVTVPRTGYAVMMFPEFAKLARALFLAYLRECWYRKRVR